MNDNTCKNCGHWRGLHHYETMQCPKGGEAAPGRKQEWLKTTYCEDTQPEKDRIAQLEARITQLESRLATLESI